MRLRLQICLVVVVVRLTVARLITASDHSNSDRKAEFFSNQKFQTQNAASYRKSLRQINKYYLAACPSVRQTNKLSIF